MSICQGISATNWGFSSSWILIEEPDENLSWQFRCSSRECPICLEKSDYYKIVGIVEMVEGLGGICAER